MVLATVLLTSASLQMRAAGLPLKPIAYVAVFFALVMVPLLVGNIALTIWPKPKAVFNEQAFAGGAAFEHPALIFGADANAAELRDAKPIFPEMVANAELAQLLIRDNGEMTLAARFASVADAKGSSARFWTAFALQGTSGSEERGWWGTRKSVGDVVHIKRIGPGLALWIGPNKDMVRKRLADVRLTTTPPDPRPHWIRLFDRIPVQVATVLLLVALAAGWFFKGAGWAGRIEGEGTPLSAAELMHRLSQLSEAESFRQTEENLWELLVPYDTFGEVGRYRFVLRLDPNKHRVLVTEFFGRRISPSASYNWHKASGITFFRSGAGIDLQRRKGPIVEAITSSGWDWQPVLWNVPSFLH